MASQLTRIFYRANFMQNWTIFFRYPDIDYLQSNRGNKPSLVHQSISADNILINHRFNTLLSCSGLQNLLADDAVIWTLKTSTAMVYLAPKYTIVGRFKLLCDVYAFGTLLFQILTGKKRTTQLRLLAEAGNFEDLINESLKGHFLIQEAKKFLGIANQRPTMESVLQELNNICWCIGGSNLQKSS